MLTISYKLIIVKSQKLVIIQAHKQKTQRGNIMSNVAYQIKGYENYYAYTEKGEMRVIKVGSDSTQKHIAVNKKCGYTLVANKIPKYFGFKTIEGMLNKNVTLKVVIRDSEKLTPLADPITPKVEQIVKTMLADQKTIIDKREEARSLSRDLSVGRLTMNLDMCINTKPILTHADIELLKQTANERLQLSQYWQLPSPYDGYVYDVKNKNVYSLISNKVHQTSDSLPFSIMKKTDNTWILSNRNTKVTKSINLTKIELMLFNSYCLPYDLAEVNTEKASYMIIETSMGFCVNKEPLKSDLEASRFCRELLNKDKTKTYLIVKVIGEAKFTETYECKRVSK